MFSLRLRWIIFLQELHQAFLDTQSEQKSPEGSRTPLAAVESCLRTLLEKKKPRLAQALAHFLQVESNIKIAYQLKKTFNLHWADFVGICLFFVLCVLIVLFYLWQQMPVKHTKTNEYIMSGCFKFKAIIWNSCNMKLNLQLLLLAQFNISKLRTHTSLKHVSVFIKVCF